MKFFLILLMLLSVSKTTSAQIVICDTMPINYNPSSIVFNGDAFSFGDSVLTVDITNNTTTNFAYPLGKLFPVTPLPPGMTFAPTSQNWYSFASSWNTGQTSNCPFFFNVTQAIPTNYTVTFDLYVSNFLPLTIDSCVFANTITINLNPSLSLAPVSKHAANSFSFSPNPAKGEVQIKFKNSVGKNEIQLVDLNGKLLKTFDTNQKELVINLNRVEAGVYYLVSLNTKQREKLVVIK